MGRHTKEGYSEKALAALMKGQYGELTGRSAANYRQPSKVPSVTAPKNTVPATATKSGKHKYRSQASMNDASMMAETQKNLEMANTLMAAASKLSASAKQPKQQGKKHRIRSNDEIPTLNFSDINRRDIRKANEQKAQDQAAKELVMQLDFQREVADNPLVNPNAKQTPFREFDVATDAAKEKAEFDREAQRRAMENASRSRNPYELSTEPDPVDPEDRPWYAVRKALGVPYEVSDRDTTYDKDFDEYHASKRSGKIRQMIKNKYHWSDEEFDNRFDAYWYDRSENEALDNAVLEAAKAREYPVFTSANTVAMTPFAALEGIGNTVYGLTGYPDNVSPIAATAVNLAKQSARGAVSEKVNEDFGGVGKFAYDAGMNLADQALMTALGGKVGLGFMSGDIAGQGAVEAMQRGIDPRKAALTGGAQGAVSLPLNLIGFDVALGKGINAGGNAVVKSLIQPTTGAIKGIGQAALSEGLEEIVEEGANKLTDVLINQDKSALLSDYSNYKAQGMSENDAWLQVAKDVGIDLAQAGLTGAAFGAVIRGYHEGASRIVPEVEAFAAEKLAEHEFNKNEDIKRIVKGELPVEEPRVPDVVENAQRQAEQARAEIERLSQQIPETPQAEVPNMSAEAQEAMKRNVGKKRPYVYGNAEPRPVSESTRAEINAENNAPVGESAPNPMQNVDFKPVIHNADGQLLDTVKVPEYSADSNVYFNGSDTDIAFAEAQDAAITDTFKNIVSDPEFNALSFKNGRQEVYVSPSTTGTGYRMSYTVDGVPTGHHDYSANEIDALSQNLREMAGNGGEDIRIQRKSDITNQTETAPVNAEQPETPIRRYDEHYSDKSVDVKKRELPQEVIDEYTEGSATDKLAKEMAKRGYNLMENGGNNNIMNNEFSTMNDALAHHLANDLIPADVMAEAYDIVKQKGGNVHEAVKLAAEMSGMKISDSGYENVDISKYRPETTTEPQSRTLPERKDGTRPNYSDMDEVNGRINEANTRLEEISQELDRLDKEYNDLENLKKNKGKKAKLSKQMYELETEQKALAKKAKVLQKIADGKKVSTKDIVEVEYPDVYENVYGRSGLLTDIAFATKFAGDTPEAKQLAQEARDALYRYLKGGDDYPDLDEYVGKLKALDKLAKETDAEYVTQGKRKQTYRYKDYFGTDYNMVGDPYDVELADLAFVNRYGELKKVNEISRAMNGVELNDTGIDTNPKITEEVGNTAPADIVETAPEPQATPVNQVPEVVNQEVTQPVNQPVNEVPTVTEDIGNVPPEPVEVTEGEDNRKTSKLAPHTLRRSDVVTEYEFENDPVVQNLLKYEAHSNDTSLKSALENVKKNHDEILNNYLTKKQLIDSDKDVDQAMLLLQELSERMRAGDDSVRAQRNLLLARLRRQATKWGQNIQAFKKWNDTAEGALINGERITDQRTKDWESRNQEAKNKNEKVAEDLTNIAATVAYDSTKINNGAGYNGNNANPNRSNAKLDNALKQQGYDGTMNIPKDPKTMEQLRNEVRKSISKEYGSIDNQFSDADIDYIANLISDGATTAELTNALNTKMATGAFGISAETEARVNSLFDYASDFDPDSKEAVTAKAAAYKLIADEVVGKATAAERFEAWRYLAMLGNPKTMIRNFVGNMTFNVVTGVSNSLSGVLEAGTDYAVRGGKAVSNKLFGTDFDTSHGINRKKSLLLPTKADKALVKGAWGDSVAHRYNEVTGSKYDDTVQNKIRQQKSVFNSKWAQLYEKVTDAGISDTAAVRAKYSTSLAGYMKANGMDASAFEADEMFRSLEYLSRQRDLNEVERATMEDLRSTHEALEKARDYAVEQAEYATFHEDNVVADILSNFSQKLRSSEKANAFTKGLGYIVEGVMPFKKTPANIVRSGYEFSPFGGASSIAKTLRFITENTPNHKRNWGDTYTTKSGKVRERLDASDLIDSWSKTLTGTGMMVLGMYLRDKGILNSSNTDEKYQDELEGKQNYSITIGGHTYTIDWAAPASMTLLMGAELSKILEANAISSKDAYNNIGDVLGTVNSLIDPIVETSMMQGVKNTLESAANVTRNDDAGGGLGILGAMAANAGTNYLTQAIPTILGQAARTVDPTRRSTDTVIDNPFVAGMEKQGRKLMNKIPFVSYLNEPYVNARGEEELNSPSANPLVSIPYQFLSPGYVQEINQTEADISAREVYNAKIPRTVNINGKEKELDAFGVPQMDKGVFETWKSKVKVGDHKFTPEEMHEYRTVSGQANEEIRTALARSDWFNELSPQKQNDLLKSVNTFVDKLGKDALGYDQDDKALDIYKNGGKNAVPDLLEYYKEKAVSSQVTEQTGLSSSTNASKAIVEDAKAGDMQAVEQKIDAAAQITNYGYERPSYIVDTYYKAQKTFPQLTVDQFIQEFNAIAGQEGDKESVSQDEIINYANRKKMPLSEVQKYWTAYGKSNWKQVPYVMDDGTIGKHKQ